MANNGLHWPNVFDTSTWLNGAVYADPVFGAAFKDNNDGTLTRVTGPQITGVKFSSLSLYLMGLIPASSVDTLKYVKSKAYPNLTAPQTGSTAEIDAFHVKSQTYNKGTFSMNDVATLSNSTPKIAYSNAPTKFHVAFILLPKYGTTWSDERIKH